MRILLVNLILHTAEKGKITRRQTNRHTMIYTMARGFIKLGHTVTLAAAEEFRPLGKDDGDFEVVYFPSRMPRIFKPDLLPWPAGFSRWLRENGSRFDLIVASETFSIPTLMAARICPGKTIIWQELDTFQKMMLTLPARFWYAMASVTMRRCPVIARSASARSFISRFMPRTCESTVDHGADEDIFYPGKERRDSFAVVSQLIPRKRIDRIIRHFADFHSLPRRGNYRLDIVGDGPERQTLEALTEKLGIKGNVTFHGYKYHSEWAEIARGAVAMLIDTAQDLNMVTVPESIVNGTPVLMNRVPATAGFVASTGAGLAADDWGAAEMAEMADRYSEFHSACLRVRPSLTNTGCAAKIISLAEKV